MAHCFDDVILYKNTHEGLQVVWRYSEWSGQVVALPKGLASLCQPSVETEEISYEFPFVITDGRTRKIFCYCHGFTVSMGQQPPENIAPAITICVLSQRPLFSLFSSIAQLLQARRILSPQSDGPSRELLDAISMTGVPEIGVKVKVKSRFLGRKATYTFSELVPGVLPDQTAPQEHNFSRFLTRLQEPSVLLLLMSALLCERKVLFVSSEPSILLGASQGVISLLQPFCWQHLLLPVLPQDLLSYICAPIPYILGIEQKHLGSLRSMPLSDLLIFHLDEGRVEFVDIENPFPTLCDRMPQISPLFTSKSISFSRMSTDLDPNGQTLLSSMKLDLNADFNYGKRTERFKTEKVVQSFTSLYLHLFGDDRSYFSDEIPFSNTEQFVHRFQQYETDELLSELVAHSVHSVMIQKYFHFRSNLPHQDLNLISGGIFYDVLRKMKSDSRVSSIRKLVSKVSRRGNNIFSQIRPDILALTSSRGLCTKKSSQKLQQLIRSSFDMSEYSVIEKVLSHCMDEAMGQPLLERLQVIDLLARLLEAGCEVGVLFVSSKQQLIRQLMRGSGRTHTIPRNLVLLEWIFEPNSIVTKRHAYSQMTKANDIEPIELRSIFSFKTLHESFCYKQPDKSAIGSSKQDLLIDLDNFCHMSTIAEDSATKKSAISAPDHVFDDDFSTNAQFPWDQS